jgi:ribosome assembly protein 4
MAGKRILARFTDEEGHSSGFPFDLPLETSQESLHVLCNTLLANDEDQLYEFYVHGVEIDSTMMDALEKIKGKIESEKILDIVYRPQAVFRVRSVTRCTSNMPGHTDSVISVQFSPNGRYNNIT